MRCADMSNFKTVDIFDATSGRWTTAVLSVARDFLAATSLPNQGLALFAGGLSIGIHMIMFCVADMARWCDVRFVEEILWCVCLVEGGAL